MTKYQTSLFYSGTILVFSAIILWVLSQGHQLENPSLLQSLPDQTPSDWEQFIGLYLHNLKHPLAMLLLQIITIIIVARFFGSLFRKINQPSVIGEILAGIMLGPSFLGHFFPEISAFLFPSTSLGNLQFLSQIGLILFMFVIGMELDLNILKNKAKDAVVISHASIIFPFSLGVILAYFIYQEFAPAHINFLSFALFTGISMSITAFPVLARIVQERGLSKTRLGTIAITCAAADDITAWCLLAAVIAIVKAGSALSSLYTIALALIYVVLMLRIIQPFLKTLGEKYANKEALSRPIVAIFFITLLVSSYVTELIGIHALFGAFMAGVIMPANVSFRSIFIEKVEDVALVLLLPLLFVFTGLRTQIGLLNDTHLWSICGLIILVAVTGKFIGSAVAARFVGQSWRESLSVGALMNTRGLMELVVLNIGYDLGVLSPEMFAMMVIMALGTTFMTGPALDLIERLLPDSGEQANREVSGGKYRILISFGASDKGAVMLRLAHTLTKKSKNNTQITCMHVSPGSELNSFNRQEYENEAFLPLNAEAGKLDIPIQTLFEPAQNIDEQIVHTANTGKYDLLLIGVGESVFEGSLLGKVLGFTNKIINPERLYNTITGKEKLFEPAGFGDVIANVTRNVNVPAGILISKSSSTTARKILVPFFSIGDSMLLIYIQKLIHNNQSTVLIGDVANVVSNNPELKESIRHIEHVAPNHIAVYSEKEIIKEPMQQEDLVLLSLDAWKKSLEAKSPWIASNASILIIKS